MRYAKDVKVISKNNFTNGKGASLHWCQLNVKPLSRKGMNSLAHTRSHLEDD
ncbi:hypothetical protein [Calothrix rhizosoleniae]|uniref:hypothetical protein n=1 Tax=Calothrix rhizosoleniae TaxID=888997 RepID=UPI0013564CBA|nr:hypothetical protein [Calothrix rhizosoleniae]